MSGPPALRPASTNTGVSPAPTPEVREIEIRYSGGELFRKASREQADAIVTQGIGNWHTSSNGREHVKFKTRSAPGRRPDAWLRPAAAVRERLQRNTPGRELTPMYRRIDR